MNASTETSTPNPTLVLRLIAITGVALSLFQLYAAGIEPLGLFFQRPIHLSFILVLCFLIYPVFGANRPRGILGWIIDGVLIGGGILVGFWVPLNIDTIANSIFPRQIDVTVGIITTILVLEAARRAVGLGMTVIASVFIVYAFAGRKGELPWLADFLPGILNHRGYSLDRAASQMTLGAEGIFGIPLGVASTFIFVFVLFGAFLEVTGAGKFFIDLAYATTGRQRGGPAKAAIVASAGMGSISGSAANFERNRRLASSNPIFSGNSLHLRPTSGRCSHRRSPLRKISGSHPGSIQLQLNFRGASANSSKN